jgi:hypothetical protein
VESKLAKISRFGHRERGGLLVSSAFAALAQRFVAFGALGFYVIAAALGGFIAFTCAPVRLAA